MLLHDIFFWLSIFFLIGVSLASLIPSFLFATTTAFLFFVIFLLFDKKHLALLSLIIIIGTTYYIIFDFYQKPKGVTAEGLSPELAEGIIIQTKQRLNYQELVLDNKIKIITNRYPQYYYGDQIIFRGKIKSANWRTNSPHFIGFVSYPEIDLIAKNKGNPIKANLIKLRIAFEKNIKRVLPHDKAVFLSGLTMGDVSEISPDFDKKLKASGTSHLVALSGYNINIIIDNLGWFLGFWPTILFILAFVIMTGAEASLVRAAIMGVILIVARKSQRIYQHRNAITFTALAMVLYDPKILVFDLGFQLSFLALLGIIYIKPFLEKITRWKSEIVWPTIAAQLAVLPLIMIKFGGFNPLSPLANILIAPAIPYTMALGFMAGTTGFASYHLSFLIAWFANIFLTYETIIINLFAVSF